MAVQDGSLHFLFENKVTTGRTSRCWVRLMSTAALTGLPTPSLPSCPFSMTIWVSQRKSWLSDCNLTGWLMTWPAAKLSFPQFLWSCFSFVPFTLATMTFLNSFAPTTNPLNVPPLILLWLTFVITMSSNLLGWIRNCPLAGPLGLQLPLPAVDRQGKEWNSPFKWLSKLGIESVKRH